MHTEFCNRRRDEHLTTSKYTFRHAGYEQGTGKDANVPGMALQQGTGVITVIRQEHLITTMQAYVP